MSKLRTIIVSFVTIILMIELSFADELEPVVIRTIPHDTESFTQGLLFSNGFLYESTGSPYGRISQLKKINPQTGEVLKSIQIYGIFSEGLTIFDNKLYLLSWKKGVVSLYSLAFKEIASVRYKGEGWGLTTDGNNFFMSDGSNEITIRDEMFNPVSRISVEFNGRSIKNLNELEFVSGKIYSNIWYSDTIVVIDPSNGDVVSVIDCSSLKSKLGGKIGEDAVLNGIAYNSKDNTFFVTGKDWPLIFVVTFSPKSLLGSD